MSIWVTGTCTLGPWGYGIVCLARHYMKLLFLYQMIISSAFLEAAKSLNCLGINPQVIRDLEGPWGSSCARLRGTAPSRLGAARKETGISSFKPQKQRYKHTTTRSSPLLLFGYSPFSSDFICCLFFHSHQLKGIKPKEKPARLINPPRQFCKHPATAHVVSLRSRIEADALSIPVAAQCPGGLCAAPAPHR